MKFDVKGTNNNTYALVQLMAWLQTRNKPLPGQIMNQFTGAIWRHEATMRQYAISDNK